MKRWRLLEKKRKQQEKIDKGNQHMVIQSIVNMELNNFSFNFLQQLNTNSKYMFRDLMQQMTNSIY